MKKILYCSCLLSLLMLAAGCKKFLEQKPLTQVPTDQFFKSLNDVNSALAGIYASFQQEMTGTGSGFTGQYFAWGEMRSDNFDFNGQYASASYRELANNALTSGNSSANWSGLYRTIARCNTAIKYIPQAAEFDNNVTPNVMNNALAQCYAMRAMCYFYIVRIWGDAVVWVEPYADVTQEDQRPRSPRDSVIDAVIIPDVQKAYSLIQKNQTPVVWYIGEAAICAIGADVHMWKKDYAGAITWITNLFKAKSPGSGKVYGGTSGSDLETTANWKANLFLNPAASSVREPIWSVHWDYTVNGCACLPNSIGASNNFARFDSVIHADWKKTKADTRVGQTMDTLQGLGHNNMLLKYYPLNGQFSGSKPAVEYNVYLVMYRLGDIYLTYAEALNKTGDRTGALKYLNFIRVRAGLPAYLATDPLVSTETALENTILNERRLELFGEGKRWFDLVRTDKISQVMDPVLQRRLQAGYGADKNRILWPISRTVLEDNQSLTQNQPYN